MKLNRYAIKIKSVLLIMVCIIMTVNLYSTYRKNIPTKLKQPDGTVIDVFLTGNDPGYIRYHDKNDFTMMKDRKTGFFCWAYLDSEGYLASTGLAVHLYNPNDLGLEPRVYPKHLRDDEIKKDTRQRDLERWIQENNKGEKK